MAACSQWLYKRITKSVFDGLRSLGKQRGFNIPATPAGQFQIVVAGMPIVFRYAWDAGKGTLSLLCTSKPLLVSCLTIKKVADEIIVQSGGSLA